MHVRRFIVAALLALVVVVGAVGFAAGRTAGYEAGHAVGYEAGQVVASFDPDNATISACVGGTDLNSGPVIRAWSWLAEDRGSCPTGYTRIDWPNDLGD